jgi:indole-3-glycerol phosphate synthase
MTILDDIVQRCRESVRQAQARVPRRALEERPLYCDARRGLLAALQRHTPAVIAEIKRASPSKGLIRSDFDPVWIARRYAEAGASALSVLTEEHFFQGSLQYLEAVRAVVSLPLLRKDFILDPYQLVEARAWGADAVLLIVAILDDGQLADLHATARGLDLDVLVEVHNEDELERVRDLGATLIGVNNRDLRTFVTRLATAEWLRPLMSPGVTAVAESGIETPADIARLRRAGYEVFLIGESLMRAPDPGAALATLLAQP